MVPRDILGRRIYPGHVVAYVVRRSSTVDLVLAVVDAVATTTHYSREVPALKVRRRIRRTVYDPAKQAVAVTYELKAVTVRTLATTVVLPGMTEAILMTALPIDG